MGSLGAVSAENQREANIEIATADGFVRPPLLNFFMTRYTAAYAAEIAAFVRRGRDRDAAADHGRGRPDGAGARRRRAEVGDRRADRRGLRDPRMTRRARPLRRACRSGAGVLRAGFQMDSLCAGPKRKQQRADAHPREGTAMNRRSIPHVDHGARRARAFGAGRLRAGRHHHPRLGAEPELSVLRAHAQPDQGRGRGRGRVADRERRPELGAEADRRRRGRARAGRERHRDLAARRQRAGAGRRTGRRRPASRS